MSHDAALHGHPEVVTTHEVHHDEHHVHHHKETFITKYVFSQDPGSDRQPVPDHRVWAILGGPMSVLFRLQLGYPDQSFPGWNKSWDAGQGGKINAEHCMPWLHHAAPYWCSLY